MKNIFTILLFGITTLTNAQLENYENAGQWPYGPANAAITHQANGNEYLFFAEGGVLHVAKLNANNQPEIQTSFPLFTPIQYLAISPDGNTLATSDKQNFVHLLNIETPESLYLLAQIDFNDDVLFPGILNAGSPYGMAFSDNNTLIAAITPKGLFALDVTDPAVVLLAGSYIELGIDWVWDVKIYDNHAWVADGFDGLSVIDISDLSQMSLILRDNSFSRLTSMEIIGDKAYLNKGLDGLNVVEIQASPVVSVTTLVDMDNTEIAYSRGVMPIGDDQLAVGDLNDGLKVYDIQDPNNPVLVSETDTGALGFTVNNQIAHVITPKEFWGEHELETHDLTITANKGAPTLLQAIPLMQNSVSIYSDDRYVLSTTDHSGLALLGISNPSRPNLVAWLYPDVSFQDGVILGDLVLGLTSDQLYISDISDPTQPVTLTPYDLMGFSSNHQIRVLDNQQIIVGGDTSSGGFKWLEINQDGTVTFLTQWDEDTARMVAKNGDLMAVAGGLDFHLVDFSDMNNPQTLFSHTLNRPIFDLEWVGNYLFIANNTDGVRIWDANIPTMANEVADIDGIITIEDIAIKDDIAYLAAGALYGLMMYDITDPVQPIYLSGLNTPGLAEKVTVSDQVLAIADKEAGVIVFSNDLSYDIIFANSFEQ